MKLLRKFLLILFLLNTFTVLYAQYDFSQGAVKERLQKDMNVLAHDSLLGREAGSASEIKARDYIARQFEDIGLKKPVGDTSYFQKFISGSARYYYNVIGLLDNKAKKTVVVGAHYDHVGLGYFGSRYGSGQIHNGADDNASGTATIIELARYFSVNTPKKYNYLFIAFSAEEKGLLGSYFFVNSPLAKQYQIAYMLNFDMVGRMKKGLRKKIILFAYGSSPEWKELIKNNKPKQIKLKKLKFGPPFSDHAPFYEKQIPVLYFTTGLHQDYHTPFDDIEFINYEGMLRIVEYLNKLIPEIEKTEQINFRKCKNGEVYRGYFYSLMMML